MTQPPSIKPARARRILLVDDDTAFTEFFKEFLLSRGPGAWVVHTADHYAPALACLKEHSVDLVVLDLRMPVMDGVQLLMLLRRTHPGLPVVVLTSSATPENRAQCLQNGASLFFDKTEIAGGLEKIYAALESVATAPAEGFRGMLRQVGISDVLQMECLGRKTSVLEVNSAQGSGRVYIEEGAIVHAELGTVRGEPALFKLLALAGGEFLLKPFSKPARRTIDAHWESLVMEAARLMDEASAPPPAAPPGQEQPGTAGPPPAPPRRVLEIVLCSGTGELFYEWQSPGVEGRIHLLNLLSRISSSVAQSLSLGRSERVEIEAREDRVVVLLQQDRRVFVRSGAQPAAP